MFDNPQLAACLIIAVIAFAVGLGIGYCRYGNRAQQPGRTGEPDSSDIETPSDRADQKTTQETPGVVDELHESVSWLPDAIVVLDSGMNLNWANSTAQKWFGINLSLHAHMDFCSLIDSTEVSQFISSCNMDDALDFSAPSLPEIIVRLRILPYKNDQFLLQARDITRVNALEKIRRDFVANTSHELSTPISVLYGYLEIMMQEDKKGISEDWRHAIQQMHGQTGRIKQIIEDMMILSRLEDPDTAEEHETFEMGPLIESVSENAKVLSGKKSHRIRTRTDNNFQLVGNRKEIESLILNLVSNAVRYTSEAGQITISWDASTMGGRLSVLDTGIGIEPDEIPRLTERFYRTDIARSRATGGTGLGLAIVNHIVNRHQAALHIDSEPGQGSNFSVRFPTSRVIPLETQSTLVLR